MNPKEYAEKAVTIDSLFWNPGGKIDVKDAGTVGFSYGYPEPRPGGVALWSGPRGHFNDGIDWPVGKLREGIAQLIEHVAEDCISVVSNLDAVSSDAKAAITTAIRRHFEIEGN